MKFSKLLVIGFVVTIMSGCVGTNLTIDQSYSYKNSDSFSYEVIDKASVTEKGMTIFKSQLDSKLEQLGLAGGNANKLVEITFNNYYMRHGAARALVGVMAGADNITSTVIIKDKVSGTIVGKLQVVSKNPTATGSARSLIQQHADKIATYIKTGNT